MSILQKFLSVSLLITSSVAFANSSNQAQAHYLGSQTGGGTSYASTLGVQTNSHSHQHSHGNAASNNSPIQTGSQVSLNIPSYFTGSSSNNSSSSSFVHTYLINHDSQQHFLNTGSSHHNWSNNGQTKLTGSVQISSTSTSVIPTTNSQAQQQINNILNSDWASWTGSANGHLTVAEVGQLLLNPKVTGSEAAVLGMIADLMNIDISNAGSAKNYSPTYSLSQIQSYMRENIPYYASVMSQLASSTNSNGSFNLYGSYSAPQIAGINQGLLNDCYFISSIEALLNINPKLIANMITQNANGTFTVTFPGGTKETVTLTDGEIAQFTLAQNGGCWLAVLGMAAAPIFKANQPYPYSAADLATPLGVIANTGVQTQALQLFTGQAYSGIYNTSTKQYNVQYIDSLLTQAFSASDPIGVDSSSHALSIIGWNAQSGIVTILNPWGTSGSYQPESNLPATVNMVNGVFTLTTTQMLADFVVVTAPSSIMSLVTQSGGVGRGNLFGSSSAISTALSGMNSNGLINSGSLVSPPTSGLGNNIANFSLFNSNLSQSSLISSSLTTIQSSVSSGTAKEIPAPITQNAQISESTEATESTENDLVTVSCSRSEVVPVVSDRQLTGSPSQANNTSIYEVTQGSMFVMREETTTINAGEAKIQIAPQAAAFIVRVGEEIIVHNFFDNHKSDIAIIINDKQIEVPMGKAVLLSHIDQEKPSTSPLAGCINPQRVTRLGKHGNATAFLGNITYAQAFKNCPQLRQFLHSETPKERKIAEKLMKASAACLTLASGQ